MAVVFAPLGVHMVGSCFLAMPGRKSYNSVHHTSDKEIVEENSRGAVESQTCVSMSPS